MLERNIKTFKGDILKWIGKEIKQAGITLFMYAGR